MLSRHGSFYLLISSLALAALTACGSPANPPPPKWTAENPNAPSGTQQKTARTSDSMSPSTASGSSLDALRGGGSTATSVSSPLKDAYFAFDRYDLSAEARATLKGNADWLNANPTARVQIEGHCDERGSDDYNVALGAKRAQAAMDYLVTSGIAKERLSMVSYGEEIPSCKEHTEACWERNRRARFVIVAGGPTS